MAPARIDKVPPSAVAARLPLLAQRSFLESRFEIHSEGQLGEPQERAALLAVLTMVLLERSRG